MDPPSQSSRDACHTTTPYNCHYWIYCTYRYHMQMNPPINQAEMPAIPLHHITVTTGSIAHIDTICRWTPPVNQAEMPAIPLHHIGFTTGSIAHIDTICRWTPPLNDIWWKWISGLSRMQFASIPIRHRRHLCYFKGKC